MRRSTLAVLATVSLAALVSVTTKSEAVQSPAVILGVLKPADSWKVGTVNVTGASFCAMVNKYDSDVGLAFARSPEGYGTVAMDLHKDVFTKDNTYEVTVKIDDGAPRKLEGKATNTRSLVVQIGQDKAMYDALNGNGTMEIVMPLADVTFSMAKFSNSFKSLLNCSGKLSQKSAANTKSDGPKMAAVKVQDVEQSSLAPIDKEVQNLNGAKTASAEKQNSLDAQLDAAATAEVKTSQANVAKLDAQHKEITAQIDAGRQQVAQLQDQQQQVQRKLLASIKTQTPPVPPANTGAVAKLWDDQQAQAAAQRMEDQAKADALQQQVATKDAQIAKLESTKAQAAEAQVAKAAAAQKALDDKAAALQKQSDELAAKEASSNSKALRAALVAKEAQLANVAAQRTAERDQLTQKLAATQSDFGGQIASLQSERDGLKTQLAAANAEVTKWQQADAADRAQAKDLQQKLAQSDEARRGLEARVAQMSGSQAQVAATDSKELAAAKAELATLKTQDAQKMAALEEKLSDKSAQFDAIKTQFDTLKAQGTTASADLAKEHQALADQVSQKQAEIDRLQAKLADIETARTAEASKARTAQADLADTRQQLQGMRKSLVVINDSEIPGRALNDIKPAAGDSDELKKAQAELATLRQKNTELSEQLAIEATKPQGAPSKSDAELATLRAQNADLTKQLAAATQAAQHSPELDKAQNELADLRAMNAELNSRLASARQAPATTTPELAKAQTELADLRAKNAELSSRLASAAAQPQKSPELDKAQADLAALRAQNADMAAKLAAKPADDGKTDAELADLRAKNAELSDKLAAATVKPAADLDKTQGELADLRAKNALLEQRLVTVVNSTPQPLPSKSSDASKAQIKAAEAEIARLRATRTDLEQQLATKQAAAPVAPVSETPVAPPSAPALAKLAPSAGDATPAADDSEATAAQKAAANLDRSSWWTAANAAARAHKVADMAPPVPEQDPSFDSNRAAAFLDRIMAYHQPAGDAAADHPPARPVVADDTPVFNNAMTHAEVAASVPPALPQPHVAQARVTQVRVQPPAVAAVEPAAGPAPVQNDPAMSTMPDDAEVAAAPAPVVAAPIPAPIIRRTPELPALAAASAARVAGASPTSLENLLTTSGVDAKFKSADGNTRQWVTGSVNGMYEQLPPGDFVANAQSYIDRYRQDCPGGLTVNMGQPQTTGAGTFAEANVSCNLQTNAYNTSFVFVQDQKKFSAILHTGYPEDASKVRNIGDNIAYALGTSGGLTAPGATRHAEASVPAYTAPAYTQPVSDAPVDAAPVRRHFNIPGAQPAQPSYTATGSAHFGARSDDGLDTVVVQ